jgi:hypothetical protein
MHDFTHHHYGQGDGDSGVVKPARVCGPRRAASPGLAPRNAGPLAGVEVAEMRAMRWILGVVTAIAAMLALATPALAGGWATTLLDPLPDRLEAGHTYTVGFWILQHGSHVSQIGLNNPGS